MKLIKMFGLAVVAAVAAMAFVGASSALATGSTALCTVHTAATCTTPYTGHVEGTLLTGTDALLETSFGNVLCTGSTLLANALGLANPQVSHVESFTFTGCEDETFHTSCDVLSTALGLLLLLKSALNVGTLESHGTEVLVKCPSLGLHCIYGGLPKVNAEGTTATQMLAMLDTNNAVLEHTGGTFCPSKSVWKAKYEIVLPDLLYILE